MLTWLEFKQHCEAMGVQDDTEISWIDIHVPYSTDDVNVHVDDNNELTVSD
ncbi:hypothetical protein NVP1251O_41 [Vibrio phage 1.251.O._10N.261.55.E5]|nr:hypothetical protein NVP1251O_41 [Vibrio phage 1.251.O._10N.261.55.E5]